MHIDGEKLGTITTGGDRRIPHVDNLFSTFKLYELPQLWNVFIDSVSLVGPQPGVLGYVDKFVGDDRTILSVRPEIAGSHLSIS